MAASGEENVSSLRLLGVVLGYYVFGLGGYNIITSQDAHISSPASTTSMLVAGSNQSPS